MAHYQRALALLLCLFFGTPAHAQMSDMSWDAYVQRSAPFRACVQSVCGEPSDFVSKPEFESALTCKMFKCDDIVLPENQEMEVKNLGQKVEKALIRLGRHHSQRMLEQSINDLRRIRKVNLTESEITRLSTQVSKLKNLFYGLYRFEDEALNSEFQKIIDGIPVIFPLSADAIFKNISDEADLYAAKKSFTKEEKEDGLPFFENEPRFISFKWSLVKDETTGRKNGLSSVRISPYSVRYPEYGIPTLIHELNHAIRWEYIDFIVAKNIARSSIRMTIKDGWDCLNRRNLMATYGKDFDENPDDLPLHAATEEDFADYVSAILLRKAEKIFPSLRLRNPLCSTYNKAYGHYGVMYENFSEKKEGQTYSSDFWRMLNVETQIQNRQISEQCRPFINPENHFACFAQ